MDDKMFTKGKVVLPPNCPGVSSIDQNGIARQTSTVQLMSHDLLMSNPKATKEALNNNCAFDSSIVSEKTKTTERQNDETSNEDDDCVCLGDADDVNFLKLQREVYQQNNGNMSKGKEGPPVVMKKEVATTSPSSAKLISSLTLADSRITDFVLCGSLFDCNAMVCISNMDLHDFLPQSQRQEEMKEEEEDDYVIEESDDDIFIKINPKKKKRKTEKRVENMKTTGAKQEESTESLSLIKEARKVPLGRVVDDNALVLSPSSPSNKIFEHETPVKVAVKKPKDVIKLALIPAPNTNSASQNLDSPKRRGRGRPRKNSLSEPLKVKISENSRGRPRKVPIPDPTHALSRPSETRKLETTSRQHESGPPPKALPSGTPTVKKMPSALPKPSIACTLPLPSAYPLQLAKGFKCPKIVKNKQKETAPKTATSSSTASAPKADTITFYKGDDEDANKTTTSGTTVSPSGIDVAPEPTFAPPARLPTAATPIDIDSDEDVLQIEADYDDDFGL